MPFRPELWLIIAKEPGGYVQWDELDFGNRRIVSVDSSFRTDHVQALLEYVAPWESSLGPKSYVPMLRNVTNTA